MINNKDTIAFYVNKKLVSCPRLVEVNGEIQLPSYQIQDGDVIETRNYYTVGQLAEFMDLILNKNYDILVNNRVTDEDEPVYENFEVEWMVDEHPVFDTAAEASKETGADAAKTEAGVSADMEAAEPGKTVGTDAEKQDVPETDAVSKTDQEKADTAEAEEDGAEPAANLAAFENPPMSKEERRGMIWLSLKASLTVGLIFGGAAFIFILFCVFVWLK